MRFWSLSICRANEGSGAGVCGRALAAHNHKLWSQIMVVDDVDEN